MLSATEEERQSVSDYFKGQAPDLEITFMQKLHSEQVLGHVHDAWDIHTNKDRWWVITNPTNLYSQEQFPNLDYAITFHMGLCLRIPRDLKKRRSDRSLLPFGAVFSELEAANIALSQAVNVAGYQAVGMRSREALVTFIGLAQEWFSPEDGRELPKKADVKGWSEQIFDMLLSGRDQKDRRRLFKSLSKEAWDFAAWLTHAKSATWRDAEACLSTTEHIIGLASSLFILRMRSVPEECPECGSPDLQPEEGRHTEAPEVIWERPVCGNCGWTGTAVPIDEEEPDEELAELIQRYSAIEDDDACIIPDVPLRKIASPESP
ncbi:MULTISPECIES: hypothetical protein [Rhizobium]|uniref:hypothetical protein n=1 Tax=Rhizobium TaxID=379 RepID=UPI0013DEAAF8|nr:MULTISPECIES: hypothetical protein [Rhizobium]NEJ96253.1 hypothetical protein [Rhizobium ruizarguesonis]WSH72196.1 hypothetical protein U8Q02_01265 [Rhizobium leguminosarum]